MNPGFDARARTMSLRGEINHSSAAEIYMQALYLQKLDSTRPIALTIDSVGGVVDDAVALYDLLQQLNVPVYTHCAGEASGGALLVLAAGRKRWRSARSGSLLQLVRPYTVDDYEGDVQEIEKTQVVMAHLLSICSGQPQERVAEAMAQRKVLTPSEAQRWGFIDRVVP